MRIKTLIVTIFFGIYLIFHGFIEFRAAYTALDGDDHIEKMILTQEANSNELQNVIDSYSSALSWSINPYWYDMLSEIYYRAAIGWGVLSAQGKKSLNSSAYYQKQSLKLTPANPEGWLRLGYVSMLKDGMGKNSADYLLMSVMTGPYQQNIMARRLKLLMTMLPYIDSNEDIELIKQQIRYLWDIDRQVITSEIIKINGAKKITQEALENQL